MNLKSIQDCSYLYEVCGSEVLKGTLSASEHVSIALGIRKANYSDSLWQICLKMDEIRSCRFE